MLHVLLTIGGCLLYTLIALVWYHHYRNGGDARLDNCLFDTDRGSMLFCWLWPFGLFLIIFLTIIGSINFACDELVEWVAEKKRVIQLRKQESERT